jgi:hypothetical protein
MYLKRQIIEYVIKIESLISYVHNKSRMKSAIQVFEIK